jgi:serine/threonine protein kinase
MQVGEFELRVELGRGAFGRVFLADQRGLNRRVALKVSLGREMTAEEGKALGGLEHDHIVKVYSAFAPPGTNWHCLCLQYVPGADLRTVIARLHRPGAPAPSGQAVLDAVDAAGRKDAGFDPAALRDREALAADDFPQAVCRVGGRLAEALAFAHARGVLHCDVKPANILLTPYGRPMLADFNVAFDRTRTGRRVGGTAAYMAPEHLRAAESGAAGAVDERCDVYSLGVVLHELATGVPPAPAHPRDPLAGLPRELARVIRRCLEPDPAVRYASAADLAAALAGAWHLLAARRALPRPGRVGRWVAANPVWALAAAGLLPHLAGSVLNISYNTVQIQHELSPPQQRAFDALVVGYNALVYPAATAVLVVLLRRIGAGLRGLAGAPGPAADDLRRRCRQLAWTAIGLGCLGWFPGAVVFPLGIDLAAGPVGAGVYGHFAVSCVLSGLIGVVFSYLCILFVLLRGVFPFAGNPDTYRPGAVGAELRPLARLFVPSTLLACEVPLTGAVLLVSLSGETMTLGFRLLVVGLIGLGVVAVGLAERLTSRLYRLAAVWDVEVDPDAPTQMPWDARRSSATGVRAVGR